MQFEWVCHALPFPLRIKQIHIMSSIDNINNKRPYVAPTVTAVVFRTERGYASSGDWVEHAANNLNEHIGTGFPDMGFWAQPDQLI